MVEITTCFITQIFSITAIIKEQNNQTQSCKQAGTGHSQSLESEI